MEAYEECGYRCRAKGPKLWQPTESVATATNERTQAVSGLRRAWLQRQGCECMRNLGYDLPRWFRTEPRLCPAPRVPDNDEDETSKGPKLHPDYGERGYSDEAHWTQAVAAFVDAWLQRLLKMSHLYLCLLYHHFDHPQNGQSPPFAKRPQCAH